jgi:hypothetical protein
MSLLLVEYSAAPLLAVNAALFANGSTYFSGCTFSRESFAIGSTYHLTPMAAYAALCLG